MHVRQGQPDPGVARFRAVCAEQGLDNPASAAAGNADTTSGLGAGSAASGDAAEYSAAARRRASSATAAASSSGAQLLIRARHTRVPLVWRRSASTEP